MNAIVEKLPAPIQVFRQELAGMEPQFKAALPAHIPAERFARVVMTAVGQNPDLLNCTRRSLWNAAMKAAQDGLLPDGREGAIVAYKDQAQWMPMVAGLRKKIRNSGEIASWEQHIVYSNDDFHYRLGDDPCIHHVPALSDRGQPVAAYSIAVLKGGEHSREVMSVEEIEAVRSRSRAAKNGPWVTDWAEMARKTVARRHAKVLPMSTDLDDLLRRDDEMQDFPADSVSRPEPPATLAGRLDALARLPASPIDHDEDGVVIEVVTEKQADLPVSDPPAAPAQNAQVSDPLSLARKAGFDASVAGHARKAVPGEYRTPERRGEADAWIEGWDAAQKAER